jgi:integrase
MFGLAVQEGRIAHRPEFPTIKVNNARKGFITDEEFGRLLDHLPYDLAPAVAFLYKSGWRVGEVRNLKWSAVNLAEGVVRIEADATNNEEARTFPFGAMTELREVLEAQRDVVLEMQRNRSEAILWVFPQASGSRLGSFRKVRDKACKAAGIPGRVPHDLRRSAVRNLERAGVPRSVAMKLTGHKTESIYLRYAIVSEADLAEAVRKLGKRA